jgi:hypothetical protein
VKLLRRGWHLAGMRFLLAASLVVTVACYAPPTLLEPSGVGTTTRGVPPNVDAGGSPSTPGSVIDAGPAPTVDGGVCTPGGWCWVNPLPLGQAWQAVFALSPTDVWALGRGGATARFTDGRWTALPPVTDWNIDTVTHAGTDLWAIAQQSSFSPSNQLLHFDGARWAVTPSPGREFISDVRGSASGELWVLSSGRTVTVRPQLHRWTGTSFAEVALLPNGVTAQTMCVRSATEVWVTAGSPTFGFPRQLYRFDGTAWTLVHEVTGSARFDSRVGCPADGVAVVKVFDFDTRRYSLLQVASGGAPTSTPLADFHLVRTPHDDVFIVSTTNQAAQRWTPAGLVPAFRLGPGQSVYSARFDFVGDAGWLADERPVLSSFDGAAFQAMGRVDGHLAAFVSMGSARDPHAVFGQGTWAHRVGAQWVFSALPPTSTGDRLDVVRVQALPSGDAWLIGSNGFGRYDATGQRVSLLPPIPAMPGPLTGSTVDALWVVKDGRVLRFDGQQWAALSIEPPAALPNTEWTDVDVASETDLVVLGNDIAGGAFASIFQRWDGSAWTRSVAYGDTPTGFARDAAGLLYVAQRGGVVKRTFEGTVLGAYEVGFVRRISARPTLEVVTQDEASTSLFRWSTAANRFERLGSPLTVAASTDVVEGATVDGKRTVWAAGAFGAILRHAVP